MAAGPEIEQLIQLLARLPGLGPRSARRAVLHLIKKKDQLMLPLSFSYYHLVIYGSYACRFVVHLAGLLADLRKLLL